MHTGCPLVSRSGGPLISLGEPHLISWHHNSGVSGECCPSHGSLRVHNPVKVKSRTCSWSHSWLMCFLPPFTPETAVLYLGHSQRSGSLNGSCQTHSHLHGKLHNSKRKLSRDTEEASSLCMFVKLQMQIWKTCKGNDQNHLYLS